MSICEDRVVIVTGAGRGIGRSHALEFARQGAKVVVNDLGSAPDGSGSSSGPANEVVEEIKAIGGEAVANDDDVSDWAGAQRLVGTAIERFGRLDVLVNNAGIIRDRTLANMSEAEWDAVVKVHLKGTFAPSHFAAAYWKDQAKAGAAVDARLINTTSVSGLFGNVGQANYGAAKGGIATFTITAALELGRYGVTVNAIAPGAHTRLAEGLATSKPGMMVGEFDASSPDNIAPIVVWLGSTEAKDVTGRVFLVAGGRITVAENWRLGPSVAKQALWDPAELGEVVPKLVAEAAPNTPKEGWAEAPPGQD